MTSFGFFVVLINIISLFIGYRIYKKLRSKSPDKKEGNIIEKGFVLFFVCLLMICINTMTFVSSYTFIWEKTYRAYVELKYEATVIGYKKELVKTQSFKGSSYYDRPVFFPKVKYINENGKEIIKTLDYTTNKPLEMGEKVKISDSDSQTSANALEINWIMLSFTCVFTALAGFFACLLFTYISNHDLKKRIWLSMWCGVGILIFNGLCTLLLYFKN